ncbi:MAG TPA: hypothetical protein VGV87_06975 [Blastocatellia bacterium]|jgi:hypothetical protein|nr:hypothetical protein [Blastocatellia bacterium]
MQSVTTCVPFEADGECAVAIKGPGVEPVRLLAESPMVFHDLYYKRMPTAPVLHLIAHTLGNALEDRPCIAAFDVSSETERRLAEYLTRQDRLRLFFVNPDLDPLEEQIFNWDGEQRTHARNLLANALRDLAAIPRQEYDFALALSEIRSWY